MVKKCRGNSLVPLKYLEDLVAACEYVATHGVAIPIVPGTPMHDVMVDVARETSPEAMRKKWRKR